MIPAAKPKAKRPLAWGILFMFIVLLLGLLGYSMLNQDGKAEGKVPFRDPPPFTLTLFPENTWDGQTTGSPATLKGHPYIINFWASWCIPCRDEALVLEKLYEEYKNKGVIFLGIAFEDRREDSLAFIKRYGSTYPNGPDVTGSIAIDYGVTGVPETYFIDAGGTVRSRYIRALTEPVMRTYLDAIVGAK